MTRFGKETLERGMVLITSLIILLALTLLGLASIQNTSMEERMAGNLRSENVALQAAEAALRAGEQWLFSVMAMPVANKPQPGQPKVWRRDAPETVPATPNPALSWWEEWTPDHWKNNAEIYSQGLRFARNQDLPTLPRYLIEERGLDKESLVVGQSQDFMGRMIYQLTARGVDAGERGEVILRSTYARRF